MYDDNVLNDDDIEQLDLSKEKMIMKGRFHYHRFLILIVFHQNYNHLID